MSNNNCIMSVRVKNMKCSIGNLKFMYLGYELYEEDDNEDYSYDEEEEDYGEEEDDDDKDYFNIDNDR